MIQIDIEMPKTCGQCLCAMKDYDYNTARCRLKYDLCFDANSRDYSNRRLDGCPLHEVTDTDTISRQQAIDEVSNNSPELDKENGELISRQTDTISRQDAINLIERYCDNGCEISEYKWCPDCQQSKFAEMIKALPPSTSIPIIP